jgi:hypothetical protein
MPPFRGGRRAPRRISPIMTADSGKSRITTPIGAIAAATAFAAAAPVATMPPSPAPLAPSGFSLDGASSP